ncbi:MAG: hypothetical protein AAF625_03450 [Pseudomonadota bacterium]
MSTAELHPMATGHIPSYVTQADGSDFLLTFMFFFTVGLVVLIGIAYFTLHSIPEKIAHQSNHPQFQLVGILALLALFTHNGLFWVAAILVAGFQFPDFAAPLRAIADAIRSLAPQQPAEPLMETQPEEHPEPIPTAPQEQ